jgi:hypothetical protein
LTCPVAVSSSLALMAISRWPIVIPFANRTGNTMFRLLLWSGCETSHLHQLYRSGHRKCSSDCHVGLASGRVEHCVQVIRQNFVASTMTNPCCFLSLFTVWEWLTAQMMQTLGSWVQIWPFLADRYAYHLANSFSTVRNVCAA